MSLNPGQDFEIVTVSFNPRDTPASAAAKKAVYLERYRRPGAADGWHFLTGDQPQIDRLTKAAGFRYVWDEATKQFAHPSGVIVVTSDGRLAKYLFASSTDRAIWPRHRRSLGGQVGTAADALLLYCYHYDPMTGRYGLTIMRAVRLAGGATVLALGAFIVAMVRRERRVGPGTGAPGTLAPGTRHPLRGTR